MAKYMKRRAALCCGLVVASGSALAQPVWQDFSVSYLIGPDYRVDYSLTSDDSTRRVITAEYAAAYSWGDLFTFVDRLASGQHQELYWELQPRLSLAPWLGEAQADSAVQEYFIAATIEMANFDDPDALTASAGSFTNALLGLGSNWTVPGFRYVRANIYRAFNEAEAHDYQLTLIWARPFVVAEQAFLYDGFVDWSSGARDHRASVNFTSQLKHDLGALWGRPESVYWGLEYVYWHNKFGIADGAYGVRSHERNLNLLLKAHL